MTLPPYHTRLFSEIQQVFCFLWIVCLNSLSNRFPFVKMLKQAFCLNIPAEDLLASRKKNRNNEKNLKCNLKNG